jgi:hypothetical protein
MPRSQPDEAAQPKPFELRVGIGGMPTLGGMFRSGDPATIPPHKFHMLVNVRITPSGMQERPGLSLEYNTGIEECINGMTEDQTGHGGELLLYPGADVGSNPATFRAVFVDQADDYSEFVFVLYGAPAVVRGQNSPVIANTSGGTYVGPETMSNPFVFRGQACIFAKVDRNGTDTPALIGMNLPDRAHLQASDCWRNSDGPVGDPLCPGPAGQETPAGDSPPLWPFQHPVGSSGVITYLENPFTSGDYTIQDVLLLQERIDDPILGTIGVGEVLYLLVLQGNSRKLVRWDGVRQTTENVSIPDGPAPLPILGKQTYGPVLVSVALLSSGDDWAALRGEDGTWSVIAGAGWTEGQTTDDFDSSTDAGPPSGGDVVYWGGKAHVIIAGWFDEDGESGNVIQAHPQIATGFPVLRSAPSCTMCASLGSHVDPLDVKTVVVNNLAYTLFTNGSDVGPRQHLAIGDFTAPSAARLPGTGLLLMTFDNGDSEATRMWIQAVGGRVYVGGQFWQWNPITQAADVTHHGVYDVTDIAVASDIAQVYRVNATDQTFDNEPERYSRGCLASVPSDFSGGEGFQESEL